MLNLYIPNAEINTMPSPCKEEEFDIGFIILKGVVTKYVELDWVTLVPQPGVSETDDMDTTRPEAQIYDVKHITLADLSKYVQLLKYYADNDCTRFMALRKSLQKTYPGIVDGEIVTLVFFAIHTEDGAGELPG